MYFKALLLLVILLIQACATPVSKQNHLLSIKQPCCNNFKQIRYKNLHPSKKNKFDINNDSPVYMFGNIKSYFSAFALPEFDGKYIQVKSYFNGMMIGQYFEPIFLVLDENHNPIDLFSLNLRFVNSNLFGDQNANMEGVFKLSSNSKYLLVFTSEIVGEQNYAKIAPSLLSYNVGDNIYFVPGEGKEIKLERSPTGKLMMRFKDFEE